MPRTRAFVVTDVDKARNGQVAAAMQALFLASGGGGLGLFTAIRRLRDSFRHMAPGLEAAGIPLYAQHVDAMDNATLVDVFRAEEDACLLGTDAMRDGVDVPGRSLRLLVFDRVPWPRPSILHRERRIHLSGGDPKAYDDALARHRLRQAFGRLIRRARRPAASSCCSTAPAPPACWPGCRKGVPVRRLGLAEVVAETRGFPGSVSDVTRLIIDVRRARRDEIAQEVRPASRRPTAGKRGPMPNTRFNPQEALVCAMVLMAASDRNMPDAERRDDVPPGAGAAGLQRFPPRRHRQRDRDLPGLLEREDGLDRACALIRDALPQRLRETAYLLACEVAAADGEA